ncbi:Gfo/Idh/MocA family oxidoreductase [Petralouisia muris]|uniref:Gfo/Idh/MocA family oxidoreductase n=1 Tax=Petralouisia muris TaxID=3032872 RepID=A0AC61RQY6_9FIRM|nr:Gfo/Idh/MocA family oxidoreductase [Petralouisia muris]TGY90920.1 Gfo/Idh/MocA family oxidoreductase [Petralouisia muris]
MKEIRLGTIGSGMIVHSILDAVRVTEGIICGAVYSRTLEKGQELAEQYEASKVYVNLEEMLADEDINFVYVASPNLLHYEQTKAALLAGKNVICEKPFCTRAKQARELVDLAKERRLFLVDAVPTAFLPNFEILKQKLSEIGKIKLVLSNYSQYSSRYDLLKKGEIPNVFNPKFGGGCLMDINFYNVYLNVALFGKPREFVYFPNRYKSLVDTSGVLVMQYDGFVSQSAGAKDTWGVNSVQVEGEEGYIYIKDGSNGLAEIQVVTKEKEEVFNCQENSNRWFYEVQNMTKMILEDDHAQNDRNLEVMMEVIEVLESARKEAGILFPGDEETA